LVEDVDSAVVGRAEHQGPEVDGSVRLLRPNTTVRRGDLVDAVVTGTDGVDLLAKMVGAA
jgi:hypothetical protein